MRPTKLSKKTVEEMIRGVDSWVRTPKGQRVLEESAETDALTQLEVMRIYPKELRERANAIVAQVARQKRLDANLKRRLGREAQRIVYCATKIDESPDRSQDPAI